MATLTSTEQTHPLVIIGIDGSDQAEHAVQHYLDMLHKKGNKVILVHIIDLPEKHHTREQFLSQTTFYDLFEEEKKKAKPLEEKYKNMLHELGVENVQFVVDTHTKPGHAIVQLAEDQHARYIVLGTRGKGLLRRTVLGSVSDYVMHHAHCPVVICRPEKHHKKDKHDKHD